jgi:hypothetical protein
MATELTPTEISRCLADHIETLTAELLPAGHREGHEWRAGNVRGETGSSLGVHLSGAKAGVWCDFATGECGDALDLVRACLGLATGDALLWSRRWLRIEDEIAELPRRSPAKRIEPDPSNDPDRLRYPWQKARPITGTLAETYLAARGLYFDDPEGRVLRFARRRARKHPETNDLEHHPALLALLRGVRSGEPVGITNVYLLSDGSDRIRDRKGKTVTGRARGSAVMLSAFDEPTMGLVVCEGTETGIAIYQSGLRPVWACGGAGNLARFPVLDGIEALTIAADQGETGTRAAETLAQRWRATGREVRIIAPSAGDWADPR